MYAVVAFCSPETIFSKFSSLVENVQSASLGALADGDRPVGDGDGPHARPFDVEDVRVAHALDPIRGHSGRKGLEELLCSRHLLAVSSSFANGRRLARGYHPRGVDFDLTPEQELIRDTVRTFARERVEPVAEELDLTGRFPYELVAELGELGLMGLPIPEQYGGAGGDTVSYAIAIEELTRIDSSVAITVAAHTSLGTMPILLYGSEEQTRALAPRPRVGSSARRLRADRARCRIRCRRDAHDAPIFATARGS